MIQSFIFPFPTNRILKINFYFCISRVPILVSSDLMSPFVHVYTLLFPSSVLGVLRFGSALLASCLRIKALWRLQSLFLFVKVFLILCWCCTRRCCDETFALNILGFLHYWILSLFYNSDFPLDGMLLTHLLHEMIIFPKGGWSNTLCILYDKSFTRYQKCLHWSRHSNTIIYLVALIFWVQLNLEAYYYYIFTVTLKFIK